MASKRENKKERNQQRRKKEEKLIKKEGETEKQEEKLITKRMGTGGLVSHPVCVRGTISINRNTRQTCLQNGGIGKRKERTGEMRKIKK